MKIALLGGSFNPVHLGHLILADCVCDEFGYDRVVFVPTFVPPHKHVVCPVPDEKRLKMLELALAGNEKFVYDSCEIDRGGVSYTYDTVCFLEEKYKNVLEGKIGLIIGNDLVADFNKWNHAEELASKTDIIIACREDVDEVETESMNAPVGEYGNGKDELSLESFPYPHKIVHNPSVKISSSQVRQRAAQKKSFRYLVTEKVFEYILNEHLYER